MSEDEIIDLETLLFELNSVVDSLRKEKPSNLMQRKDMLFDTCNKLSELVDVLQFQFQELGESI